LENIGGIASWVTLPFFGGSHGKFPIGSEAILCISFLVSKSKMDRTCAEDVLKFQMTQQIHLNSILAMIFPAINEYQWMICPAI